MDQNQNPNDRYSKIFEARRIAKTKQNEAANVLDNTKAEEAKPKNPLLKYVASQPTTTPTNQPDTFSSPATPVVQGNTSVQAPLAAPKQQVQMPGTVGKTLDKFKPQLPTSNIPSENPAYRILGDQDLSREKAMQLIQNSQSLQDLEKLAVMNDPEVEDGFRRKYEQLKNPKQQAVAQEQPANPDKSFWENAKDGAAIGWESMKGQMTRGVADMFDVSATTPLMPTAGLTGQPQYGDYGKLKKDQYEGKADPMLPSFIQYADKQQVTAKKMMEDRKANPESWGYLVGSLLPQSAGIATAIGVGAVNPVAGAALGYANAVGLSSMAMGAAAEDYDTYVKDKNEGKKAEIESRFPQAILADGTIDYNKLPEEAKQWAKPYDYDPNARLGSMYLSAAIEQASEMIPVAKFIPKAYRGKMAKYVFGNTEIVSKTGADLIREFAETNASRAQLVKNVGREMAEGALTEGPTEGASQLGQEFSSWLWKEKEDRATWQEMLHETVMATVGGSIMGFGLGPLSYGAQQFQNRQRRKQSGKVILAQDQTTGEAIEIMGMANAGKDGKPPVNEPIIYEAIRPNGKIYQVDENQVGAVVEIPEPTFNGILKGKGKVQTDEETQSNQDLANTAQGEVDEAKNNVAPFIFQDPDTGADMLETARLNGSPVFVSKKQGNAYFITDPATGEKKMVSADKLTEINTVPVADYLASVSPVAPNSPAPFDPSNPIQVGENITYEGENWVVTGVNMEQGSVQLESMDEDGIFETIGVDQFQQIRKPAAPQAQATPEVNGEIAGNPQIEESEPTGAAKLREIFTPKQEEGEAKTQEAQGLAQSAQSPEAKAPVAEVESGQAVQVDVNDKDVANSNNPIDDVMGKRNIWIPNMKPSKLKKLLEKDSLSKNDIEDLKDFKYFLLTDRESAAGKGFYTKLLTSQKGSAYVLKDKFLLTNIEDKLNQPTNETPTADLPAVESPSAKAQPASDELGGKKPTTIADGGQESGAEGVGQEVQVGDDTQNKSFEENYELEPAKNIEDIEKNINQILTQYPKRDFNKIRIEQYLNEKTDLAKKWIDSKGIKSRDDLHSYIEKQQVKTRKGKGLEKRKAEEDFQQKKTENSVDQIMQQALEAEAEMQQKIKDLETTPTPQNDQLQQAEQKPEAGQDGKQAEKDQAIQPRPQEGQKELGTGGVKKKKKYQTPEQVRKQEIIDREPSTALGHARKWLLTGGKLNSIQSDTNKDKGVGTGKGIREETGMSGREMNKFIGILDNKNGVSTEVAAERIHESLNEEMAAKISVQELRNALNEVLLSEDRKEWVNNQDNDTREVSIDAYEEWVMNQLSPERQSEIDAEMQNEAYWENISENVDALAKEYDEFVTSEEYDNYIEEIYGQFTEGAEDGQNPSDTEEVEGAEQRTRTDGDGIDLGREQQNPDSANPSNQGEVKPTAGTGVGNDSGQAYVNLKPSSNAINALKAGRETLAPKQLLELESNVKVLDRIMGDFPQLNVEHENEIFDLINSGIDKNAIGKLVANKVNTIDFDRTKPLNLRSKASDKPVTKRGEIEAKIKAIQARSKALKDFQKSRPLTATEKAELETMTKEANRLQQAWDKAQSKQDATKPAEQVDLFAAPKEEVKNKEDENLQFETDRWTERLIRNKEKALKDMSSYLASKSLARDFNQSVDDFYKEKRFTKAAKWISGVINGSVEINATQLSKPSTPKTLAELNEAIGKGNKLSGVPSEVTAVVEKYNWTAIINPNGNIEIANSKGKPVATVKVKGISYRIEDMGGRKLLTGNGKLGQGVEKLLTEYYYAKPIENKPVETSKPYFSNGKVIGKQQTEIGTEYKVKFNSGSGSEVKVIYSNNPDLKVPTEFETEADFNSFKENASKEVGTKITTPTPPKAPTRPADYGKSNKVVSQKEADEAKQKLKDFFKGKGGKLYIGLDPEIMVAGLKYSAYHIEAGARKFADYAKAMIEDFGEGIAPYLPSFYTSLQRDPDFVKEGISKEMTHTDEVDNFDLAKFVEELTNNQEDVSNRPGDSQPDQRDGQAEIQADGTSVSGGRGTGGKAGTKNQAGGTKGGKQSKGGKGRGNVSSNPSGINSLNDLFSNQPEPSTKETDSGIVDGRGNSLTSPTGTDAGQAGNNDVDSSTSKEVESFASKTAKRLEQQKKAESIPAKAMDLDNIRETLPMLLPEQQEDVFKAENRFFNTEKHTEQNAKGKGYLFTNGTGTGKTYTGLGIVKRFLKQGKKDILIITPSQTKVTDWIDDAKNLGIEAKALTGTKDKGQGVSITTFATFRANEALFERDFDLIVYDESHRIMEDKKGKASSTTAAHFKNSNTDVVYAEQRIRDGHPLGKKRLEISRASAKIQKELDGKAKSPSGKSKAELANELGKLQKERDAIQEKLDALRPQFKEQAKQAVGKTKVVFLSATPFKEVFNLRYANGVLFDWGNETTLTAKSNGMSRVNPEGKFFMDNFGSRFEWKNNQLQQKSKVNPEAISMQEIAFNTKLQQEGVMSGRAIESDMDYQRHFPILTGEKSERFNEAVNKIFEGDSKKYEGLRDAATNTFFNGNYVTQLLESMKASLLIPRIEQHLELGRKLIIFHRRQQANIEPPFFRIINESRIKAVSLLNEAGVSPESKDKAREVLNQADAFEQEFKDLFEYEKGLDYRSAVEQFAEHFGDKIRFQNGQTSDKEKKAGTHVKDFNEVGGPVKIIMVQEESGKEGISLHDTSGKEQRVLISLSMPRSSTTALQIEGRSYRIGVSSNVPYEYPILGMDFEIAHFASGINKQVSTTENLSLGDSARDLLNSFVAGIQAATDEAPHKEQGIGGKEQDKRFSEERSQFRKAMLYYQSNQKTRGRRDQREGIDFYATPEPVGQKMVEFLGLEPMEKALEPSAGKGAIAMWFPGSTNRTVIEPSMSLFGKLSAVTSGATQENMRFEDHNIINKYHGIAMNPPFGSAGKLAMDHLEKALKHLYDGGRVAALIPRGKMDQRLEEFLESKEGKNFYLRAEYLLPSATFEQAGTQVNTRIVVIDKIEKPVNPDFDAQTYQVDLTSAKTVDELFERMEFLDVADRVEVQDKKKVMEQLTGIEEDSQDIKEVKASIINNSGEVSPESFQYIEKKHTESGEILHYVDITGRLPKEIYDGQVKERLPKFKGWFDRYNKMLRFKTKEGAEAFIQSFNTKDIASEPKQNSYKAKNSKEFIKEVNERNRKAGTKKTSIEGSPVHYQGTLFAGDQYLSTERKVPGKEKEFQSVAAKWNQDKNFQFTGGDRIKSPDDVANLMRLLETAAVEHGFIVHIDEKGQSHVQILSYGGITGTIFDSRVINQGFTKFGTKSFYFVHNHPSGNLQASDADIKISEKAMQFAEKLGIAYNGHVIMDALKGMYVFLSPSSLSSVKERKNLAQDTEYPVNMLNMVETLKTPYEKTKIFGSQNVAQFIQQLNYSALPKAGVLVMSNANEIIGNFILEDISTKEIAKIVGAVPLANAIITYGNKKPDGSILLDIGKAKTNLRNMDISYLDHVYLTQSSPDVVKQYEYFDSLADEGLMDVATQYGTNQPSDQIKPTPKSLTELNESISQPKKQTETKDSNPSTSPALRQTIRPSEPSASAAQISDQVDQIASQWGNAPEIIVVNTPQEALAAYPDELAQHADNLDEVPGVMIPNTKSGKTEVVLIASHAYLNTKEGVEKTILHEVVGHHGIREGLKRRAKGNTTKFNNLYNELMDMVFAEKSGDKLMEDIASRYFGRPVKDLTKNQQTQVADEFLAHLTQEGVQDKLIDRVIHKFRQMLRALGIKLRLKDSEIRAIIGNSMRLVAKGKNGVQVRQGIDPNSVPARMMETNLANLAIVDGFYSPIEKRIIEFKQPNASATKWKEIVGKKDEALWTGVYQYLDGLKPDQQVTKKELQDWMKDNRVKIEVVELGGFNDGDIESWWNDEGGANEETPFDELSESEKREARQQYADEIGDWGGTETKFSQYQLEGDKEDYKEVLVTLPEKDNGASRRDKNYRSSHFDEPNIVVHLRMNTRTDSDGNKVLFLEEVQSDYGQEGKRKGFYDDIQKAYDGFNSKRQEIFDSEEYRLLTKKAKYSKADLTVPEKYYGQKKFTIHEYLYNNPGTNEIKSLGQFETKEEAEKEVLFLKNFTSQDQKRLNELEKQAEEFAKKAKQEFFKQGQSVPSAPFVTDTNSWVKLGLKVALKEAVAQGADRIAWTTGTQQNERYDLSKQVDGLAVYPSDFKKDIFEVHTLDKKGSTKEQMGEFPLNELPNVIGKELADRAIKDINEGNDAVYIGEQLQLGGTGMKSFYGDPSTGDIGIVGRVAESIVGKGMVGTSVIDNGRRSENITRVNRQTGEKDTVSRKDENLSTQHSIPVTPELIAQVESGLPMFMRQNQDQTQTPAFKKWFGDSKVVDEQGKPMVVYHGTDKVFDNFKPGFEGANFFSESPKVASVFSQFISANYQQGNANVIPSYLSIKNPLIVDLKGESIKNASGLVKKAKSKGYDGLIIKNADEIGDSKGEFKQYAAFSPTQIKSATSNNGDFDGSNPDIRFMRVGNNTTPPQVTQAIQANAEKNWKELAIEKLQDSMISAKKLIKAKTNGKVSDKADFYTKENLSKGKALVQSEEFIANLWKPFLDLAKAIKKETGVSQEQISDYLKAKHHQERKDYFIQKFTDEGRAIPKDTSWPTGMEDQWASDTIADFEGTVSPEQVKDLHKKVQAMTVFVNKKRFTSGMISKQVYRDLMTQYKHYVPLRDWKDMENTNSNVYSPLMSAKGRKSEAADPVPFLYTAAQEAIMRGENNLVRQSVLEFVKENISPGEYFIRNSYYIKTGEQDDMGNDIWMETQHKPSQAQLDAGDAMRSFNPEVHRNVQQQGERKNVLPVLVKGKRVFIEFKDSSVPMAVKNMNQEQVAGWLGAIRGYTRWLSSMYTQYSPEFGIRNLIRDMGFGTFNIIAEKNPKTAIATLGEMRKSMPTLMKNFWNDGKFEDSKEGRMLKEYMEEGAMTGYSDLKEVREIFNEAKNAIDGLDKTGWTGAKHKVKAGIETALKPIDVYNRAFENAMRFSYYKVLRTQGESKQQAAAKAKDLTVNFNRKGTWTSGLGSIYIFFNASVQGTEKLGRNFVKPETRKKAYMMAGGLMALGLIQSMMLGLGGEDDEDGKSYYEKIPDHVRRNNIIIPKPGNGEYFKIPLPYGINVFWGMGESLGRVISGQGKGKKEALGVLSLATNAFSPLGGYDFTSDKMRPFQGLSQLFTPSALQPVSDLMLNQNFAGFPIYRENFTSTQYKKPDSQMYFEGVNPAIKGMTDLLNTSTGGDKTRPGAIDINPEWIEYGFEQYFGGPVQFAQNMGATLMNVAKGENILEDPYYRKIPFVRSFVQKTGTEYQIRQDYYQNYNEVNLVEQIYKDYISDGETASAQEYFEENKRAFELIETAKWFNKEVKKLNDVIGEIKEAYNKTGDEKLNSEMDKIFDQRNKLMEEFNKEYNSKSKESEKKAKVIKTIKDIFE